MGMSKRVTLNDGARVEDRHHHLRLLDSKLAGRSELEDDSAEEVESRLIDGSLAPPQPAEQWRKKGTGKLQTSRQPCTMSGAPNTEPASEFDREEPSPAAPAPAPAPTPAPAPAMVEQLENSETRKRGFEQVCILSRNPNDEADFGFQDELADEATEDDEDSYEKIALGIGMLQARVLNLRNQLRESMFQRPAGRHAKSVAVRFRSAAGAVPLHPSTAAKGFTSASRRKASDYDINNVVMPVSVGANYVEHIRHERIETPKWRLVPEAHAAESSSSSENENENTDDEAYHQRHAELEAREKRNRLPEKKSGAATSGAGDGSKSKSKVKAKGSSKPKSKAGRPRKHKLPTLDTSDHHQQQQQQVVKN